MSKDIEALIDLHTTNAFPDAKSPLTSRDRVRSAIRDAVREALLLAECLQIQAENEARENLIKCQEAERLAGEVLEALQCSQELWLAYGSDADPAIPIPEHHRDMERKVAAAISKAEGRSLNQEESRSEESKNG